MTRNKTVESAAHKITNAIDKPQGLLLFVCCSRSTLGITASFVSYKSALETFGHVMQEEAPLICLQWRAKNVKSNQTMIQTGRL